MNFSIYIDPQFRASNLDTQHNNSPASSSTISPQLPQGVSLPPQNDNTPVSSFNLSPSSPQNILATHFISFPSSPDSAISNSPGSPQNPQPLIRSIIDSNSLSQTQWERSPSPIALFAQTTLAAANPANITTLIERAKNYLSEEKWDLAIEVLETIPARSTLEKEKILGIAFEAKGIAELKNKNYDDANRFFKLSLYSNPKSTVAWSHRGAACLNLKSYYEAHRCFTETLELDPNDPSALIGLGVVCEANGEIDSAIEWYKKAFNIIPSSKEASQRLTEAYETKALAYKKNEQYDEAISQLKLSAEINEERAFPHFLMGNLYYLKLENEEALKCYDRALQLAPGCSLSLAGKGEVFLKENKLDQAFSFLEQAYQLDPQENYIKILLNKTLILTAKKCLIQNRKREAIELYTRSIHLYPGELESLNERALIYYKEGYYTAAENDFKAALKLNPNHYQMLALLGASLIKNGKFAESIQTLKKALVIKPNDPFALNRIQEAYHGLAANARRLG